MKIIVGLKEIIDPALSLDFGLGNPVVFGAGRPRRLDPAAAAALNLALKLKDSLQAEIILISIGGEGVSEYLRDGLAAGAGRAVRIADAAPEPSPWRKARLLAQAARLYNADIIFTGARSLDTASGQVGPLTAGWLGWPCGGYVTGLEPDGEKDGLILSKDIGRGERERVSCQLPAVITVRGEGRLPYARLDSLIASRTKEIEVLTPADLGLAALAGEPVRVTSFAYPRPRPRKAPPLDSSLPAFERILQLLQGGIAKRRGRMLPGDSEEVAGQLFELLKEAGVIRPAAGQ
jgi:electron transfer flavoprotein beta subunit